MKQTPLHRKRKPKTRRQRLEAQTDKLVSGFYRGLRCICCDSHNTVGHHLISRQRCRFHRHSPQNLVPLCSDHHKWSNEMAAHSFSSLGVAAFVEWLKVNMPKRYAWWQANRYVGSGGYKVDYQADNDFWQAALENERSYEWVCDLCKVEAYRTKEQVR